ncbi:methionyl-tRNA formyltransferase [Thiothrix nivea]|uniref:Methionyl-tRNA formyltransferase n=1 Tax=Thiothrix nivea (strain ATCC 35100 / DSM 5205 / JP2) TaxID=870187 RepID=A0A656HIL2_THINJ|nr:methionyl-tRNA formyltransferase [Thiothrix nivea]EIJ35059.1 methionyl-tRNA formyltransferase [Thiothrix nivea DSM 5205]
MNSSAEPAPALKIVYAGTPDFAVPALQALLASHHQVVAVYCQPDRPSGRGRKLSFGPVKQVAVEAGIPVEQPLSLKPAEEQDKLRAYAPDVMIVAAYGLILPQAVLDIPRYGCLNIHGSLLPRWRGAAPIQRAIQTGDRDTGVTIMQMAAGLDTGDMLYKAVCPITAQDGGQSIHDKLAAMGAEALLHTLDLLCAGKLQPEPQDDALANYAHKLNKAEAEIDWTQPASVLDRTIRAFDAWPTAYTLYDGKPLRLFASCVKETPPNLPFSGEGQEGGVRPGSSLDKERPGGVSSSPGTVIAESREGIDIATGDGVVRILSLQLPGGKRLSAEQFLNGRSLLGVSFLPSPLAGEGSGGNAP